MGADMQAFFTVVVGSVGLLMGVLIIIGLLTRPVALAFAGFCTLTALLFHNNLASSAEAIQFGKDFAMAGGFLFLIVTGAGQWSLDARIGAR